MKTIAKFNNENYIVKLEENEKPKLYAVKVFRLNKIVYEPIAKGEFKTILYAKKTFINSIKEILENDK